MVTLPPGQEELLNKYLGVRKSDKTNVILNDIMELESMTPILNDAHVWYYPTRDKGLIKGHSIDHNELDPDGDHFNRYIFVKSHTKVNLYHYEGVPLFMPGFIVQDVPTDTTIKVKRWIESDSA